MSRFSDDPLVLAQLFHGIVDQSVAGIYLLQDGVLKYVNDTYADMFGTTPDRMIGRTLRDLAPAGQRESLVAQYERRIKGEDPASHFLIRTDVRDRGLRLIEIHGTRVEYVGRPAVVGVGIDVTEREIALAELLESRAKLRALMSAVETSQETERRRIAMEIHDEVGGILTALKFDITRLSRRVGPAVNGDQPSLPGGTAEEIHALASSARELIQDAIEAVRRISDDLRPSVLEHFGLFAALRDHINGFQARFGISCSVALPEDISAAPPATELDLFRVVQEVLTNVARHAAASQVSIDVRRDGDHLNLAISDNGRGLQQSAAKLGRGLGLAGARERAHRLGGTLEIDDVRPHGVRVHLRIPWRFRPTEIVADV